MNGGEKRLKVKRRGGPLASVPHLKLSPPFPGHSSPLSGQPAQELGKAALSLECHFL